jgi:formylglycine-generating enzyme required for sulfatase activity
VNITVSANGYPTAEITGPREHDILVEGYTINFAGTGVDPEDGELSGNSLVWTSNNDGRIGTGTSFNRNDLSVDDHVITLTATDSRGYTGVDYINITIIPAVVPTATISKPVNNEIFTWGDMIDFCGTAIDPEDYFIPEDSIKWTSDKDGLIGTGTCFSRNDLTANKHVITLTATDRHGNTGSDEVTVTVLPFTDAYDLIAVPATSGFPMGRSGQHDDQKPVHTVSLDAFQIGKYEVTNGLWSEVKSWAVLHGYNLTSGGARASGFDFDDRRYPVEEITWRECIAWCNAYSEKEGLTPVYYTNSSKTILYRDPINDGDISNDCVDWGANGYRLPTEAEWEYAARYINGTSYSPGNEHSGSNRDPFINNCAWYDGNSNRTTHPVGQKKPSSLNIYDMSGNVWEWCWDWYDSAYYETSPADNPRGPETGSFRVFRGGCFHYWAMYCRTSYRVRDCPYIRSPYVGFRVCRGGSGD